MFKLKILAIDWFAQDLSMMFGQFRSKVEFVTPPEEVMTDFEKLYKFVEESDAHVVFLEEEIHLYPKTGADLVKACHGKILYDTSPFKSLRQDESNQPTFPRNGIMCPFPSIFLHHNGMGEALLFAFIHNLRHFVEAKEEQKN